MRITVLKTSLIRAQPGCSHIKMDSNGACAQGRVPPHVRCGVTAEKICTILRPPRRVAETIGIMGLRMVQEGLCINIETDYDAYRFTRLWQGHVESWLASGAPPLA